MTKLKSSNSNEKKKILTKVFNRRGVARAVLQTPLSLIHSFIKSWFVKISLRRRHTLKVGNGAFSHKINYITIYFPKGQSGEASWLRLCYQRGLPCLVC